MSGELEVGECYPIACQRGAEMAKFSVASEVKSGVIVLAIEYDYEGIQKPQSVRIRNEVLRGYRRQRGEGKEMASCVVSIGPEFVNSTINRVLFELWKEVGRDQRWPSYLCRISC